MSSAEENLRAHHIVQQSALPAAPMAMPEQVLSRRWRGFLLRPFLQWLALR
ncbi:MULTISPECIES: hypothetical protein [Chelativorans]|jgi:hypothetical protein|uniref:hypothetical protein n=1 Tax=Chelativorans TaxID=449972 RepID=UPI00031080DA|nr:MULTISPECIES: hypothetical protein [Chelativorans]